MKLIRRLRGSRSSALRWSIVTSAPKGEAGDQWGDTWFARDLADALRRAGQHVTVVSRAGADSVRRLDDDVVVVLRGLRAVEPPKDRRNIWMLWVISHPQLVTESELRAYDAVFGASMSWRAPGDVEVTPLLQATSPSRFHPRAAAADSGAPVLFVGSTRGQFRPVVRGALRSRRADDVVVYGVGWQEFLAPEQVAGEFLANDQLPAAYASAYIVLNDHHTDMADAGFLSNRLFDAVATGSRVLSDKALGLSEVFGSAVVTFADEQELVELLEQPIDEVFADRAQRLQHAARVAREHSFDARAAVLLDRAIRLKAQAGP